MINEDTYRLAIQAGGVGTWDRYLATDLVTICPVMAHIMGLTANQTILPARQWQNMILPEDQALLAMKLEEAIFTDEPFDMEFRLLRPDGQVISLISRGRVTKNESGQPVHASGVCFVSRSGIPIFNKAIANAWLPSVLPSGFLPNGINLTTKQQKVLQYTANGYSVKEIAEALNISIATVREHQRQARNRLGAKSVLHAVSLALQYQLLMNHSAKRSLSRI